LGTGFEDNKEADIVSVSDTHNEASFADIRVRAADLSTARGSSRRHFWLVRQFVLFCSPSRRLPYRDAHRRVLAGMLLKSVRDAV
jgi:hypothetical protein